MKFLNSILFLFISIICTAQSVGVGTVTPHSSAALDITSSDKGLLIPRVDPTDISNPSVGLMTYSPTDNGFYFYTGSDWQKLGTVTEISDADNDTKIEVEQSSDADKIVFTTEGQEALSIHNGQIDMPFSNTNVFIGHDAGKNDTGDNNVTIGWNASESSSGSANVFVGSFAGSSNTSGYQNTFIGHQSGLSNTEGWTNVSIGKNAGSANTTGIGNVNIGFGTSFLSETGSGIVAIGNTAGYFNTHPSGRNVFLGESAGKFNNGKNNTFLGADAGENAPGSGCIFIGRNAGTSEMGDNKLYIDNSGTSTPLIYGNFSQDSLIVNGDLSINSAYTFPSDDGLSNQVISTDGNGNLSWTTPEGNDDDWTSTASGFYNDTDRFSIGSSTVSSSRKLFVESNSETYAAFFENKTSSPTTHGIYSINNSPSTTNKYGVFGWASDIGTGNRVGVFGGGYSGTNAQGYGAYFVGYSEGAIGMFATGQGLAGQFVGNVFVNGNTGIGTEDMDAKLHVHKSTITDMASKIRFTDNVTGTGSSVTDAGFEVGLGSDQEGIILHHSNEKIEFYTNTTDKVMTLEPDGDLLIGINGESDQLRMDQGSVRIVNLGSSNDDNGFKWAEDGSNTFGMVYDGSGSGNTNKLNLREYIGTTSDIMTIEAGGDIGIQNSNPGFDLHLGNNSAAKPLSSAWSVTSDARSKVVDGSFDDGLSTVLAINPVRFTYNGRYGLPEGLQGIGTIAQELKEVAPYMINQSSYKEGTSEEEDYLTIDYGAMDFVIINAIKELKLIIDAQAEKIEALEKLIKE